MIILKYVYKKIKRVKKNKNRPITDTSINDNSYIGVYEYCMVIIIINDNIIIKVMMINMTTMI